MLWLIDAVMSGSRYPVLETTGAVGLRLDPLSFGHDGWPASDIDEVAKTLTTDSGNRTLAPEQHRRKAWCGALLQTLVINVDRISALTRCFRVKANELSRVLRRFTSGDNGSV